jgi:hypothetical protein
VGFRGTILINYSSLLLLLILLLLILILLLVLLLLLQLLILLLLLLLLLRLLLLLLLLHLLLLLLLTSQLSEYPFLHLRVRGTSETADTARAIPSIFFGRCINEAPQPRLHTRSMGQPMLMSIKSTDDTLLII